jgi:hypothetical protein
MGVDLVRRIGRENRCALDEVSGAARRLSDRAGARPAQALPVSSLSLFSACVLVYLVRRLYDG